MGSRTGPRLRRVRRLGTVLPGLTRKSTERRPYPPGHRGRRPRRLSDYAVHLAEKQKLRFHYGLTETQLRTIVYKAERMPGSPADSLATLLESRLDNVAFRLGFAPTIPSARQLVRHGHIFVNKKEVNIPSFSVAVGAQVSVKPTSKEHPNVFEGTTRGPQLLLPDYLERSRDGLSGKMKTKPLRADIPVEFDDRLVIEYYAA